MDKRGQFFLIAALIAVGILYGLTIVINVARGGDPNEAFYDLGREVDYETNRVLDYGVFYEKDTEEVFKDFLTNYSDYIAQEKVIFVFGNDTDLEAFYFKQNVVKGEFAIGTGGAPISVPIQESTGTFAEVKKEGDNLLVTIEGITYSFKLLKGQKFFFVIIKEEDEEAFVATG